jgi:F420-non-reducing hydrogenase iron-sulfur subunit
VEYVQKTLAQIGIEPDRVQMFNLSSAMGPKFAQIATEMTEKTQQIGPSPLQVVAPG